MRILLIIAGFLLAAPVNAETANGGGGQTHATANAERLLDMINRERVAHGCGPLRMDDRLVAAADRHSLDMITEGFIDHVSPTGSTLTSRVADTGYRSGDLGENIQVSSGVLSEVADITMENASQRANLLNCAYTETGIAARIKRDGPFDSFYWTQIFATPEPIQVVNSNRSTERVLYLINAERAKHGCQPLHVETRLMAAANRESQDMVDRHFFSHTAPDGATPGERVRATGYVYQMVGENIEVNTYDPQGVVEAWMKSPGHRENILMCAFRETGIAVAYQPDDTAVAGVPGTLRAYWTQVFAMPLNLGR
ncbi:hypothetical protein AEAC466_15990 [Asticcacaulis sp. AC466]|uniref:CAP domain-containing protein n=1 Tax=Asticcacaulis sp. AC466 TaxID=1282362 RepID=UPI0003C3EEBB|nr:CAP domain-containing protein [Asticcacaulis sp. AC466]ESQ82640.1 hypothetical protein AEAC466_15990 [Asticcacaulis sp. AC466]